MTVSDDGNLMAYATDTTGYRQYTLQIKDLATGKMFPNKIERVTSVRWSNDGKYLFYSQEDPVSKRSHKVFRHTLATNKNDLTMNEIRYLAADNPTGEWKVISPRREGHEYSADFDSGEFYITTNKDAENFKVVKAPASDPTEKSWQDYIAHDPKIKVEGVSFFKDYAVVSERENGLEYVRVLDRKTKRAPVRIDTPESVYTMGLSSNPEYDTPIIRYSYASMITPNSTYEYDLKTGKSTLIKQQEIPSGYDKTKYETKREWAVARDGTKVPVSIVWKKGTKIDGSAPMLLYAYGSYGISMTPNFSIASLSLDDRGMIYAIAHIRGGSEQGEKWRQ